MLDIKPFQKSVQKNPRIEQVQEFLRMICLEANVCREDIGTTWAELYVMYKKAGFDCAAEEPTHKAEKKPSMGMHIIPKAGQRKKSFKPQ